MSRKKTSVPIYKLRQYRWNSTLSTKIKKTLTVIVLSRLLSGAAKTSEMFDMRNPM